ncbi:tyrosine-protein kinase receptor Tie-1-like [Xenia sp. Carnegie-2017]|uniref:tyrosine-protein kinase receptor Tie-1-like n=1 Tax=Xenia sp. Carnegie-2017 TaxID=2897299 RepID=UPI001F0483ED|nr:tyrosine-protein kinase receptor Tie-1-like [Xenia sp. Carnegie-2017]
MAIESIKESLYTEKSDIWSFGIVLWELFTLGGTPYLGIPDSEVYKILLSWKRMEPPIHCSEEMSYLMMKCWNENPELRPTFLEVKDRFDVLISSNKKLNLDEKIYVNENIIKNEKKENFSCKGVKPQRSLKIDNEVSYIYLFKPYLNSLY